MNSFKYLFLDEKFNLILEFLAMISHVAMVFVRGVVFGFVSVQTMAHGMRPFHVWFISDCIQKKFTRLVINGVYD